MSASEDEERRSSPPLEPRRLVDRRQRGSGAASGKSNLGSREHAGIPAIGKPSCRLLPSGLGSGQCRHQPEKVSFARSAVALADWEGDGLVGSWCSSRAGSARALQDDALVTCSCRKYNVVTPSWPRSPHCLPLSAEAEHFPGQQWPMGLLQPVLAEPLATRCCDEELADARDWITSVRLTNPTRGSDGSPQSTGTSHPTCCATPNTPHPMIRARQWVP